jgi:small subunit ribosomal protein S20
MPITKSAQKALRQNKKRKAHNLQYVKKVKNLMKKASGLVLQNKPDELKQLLPSAYKALDKAAKVGIIKKSNAARKKSSLAKRLNAIQGQKTP